MFRKLISNLLFSPSLVGHLGVYAKRIKREEAIRRAGLIFLSLSLIVQCIAIFQPPESANASSTNDFVYGGLGNGSSRDIDNFLRPYDENVGHLKDIMNYAGITRSQIQAAHFSGWTTGSAEEWSRNPQTSYQQGERSIIIANGAGIPAFTVYARPLESLVSNKPVYGWVGYSHSVGRFAILQANGNLVTTSLPPSNEVGSCTSTPSVASSTTVVTSPCTTASNVVKKSSCPLNPQLSVRDVACQPCIDSPLLWTGSTRCASSLVRTNAAFNLDQNVDATTSVAHSNDRIRYTITARNVGSRTITASISDDLHDSLEYAHLLDAGGATYDNYAQTLSWENIALLPGQSADRTYVIQVDDSVPATARGVSNEASFDCTMTNIVGTSTSVPVACPVSKNLESLLGILPKASLEANVFFMVIVFLLAVYFYARARQIKKEVRLIRRDLNAGII